jgi:hypothetical protein
MKHRDVGLIPLVSAPATVQASAHVANSIAERYDSAPVTSVKTHGVSLSVWFDQVLNSRVLVLCSLSLPVTHLAEREPDGS